MKIKLLTLMSGPDGTHQPGTVIDKPAKEAKALIDGGYAVAVETAKPKKAPVETATNDGDKETATTQ